MENPHGTRQNPKTFKTLDRISKKIKDKNIKFIFVVQPYRSPLVKNFKHVKPTMNNFIKNAKIVIYKNGGLLLNLHSQLHLADKYFADRSHLNDKGSKITSKAIANFIDKNSK